MAWPAVSQAAQAPAASLMAQTFLQPLWLFPVATWLALAAAVALQMRQPDRRTRSTLIAIGAAPLLQALALFAFVGHFVGAYALLLAGTLIWLSAAAMPGQRALV